MACTVRLYKVITTCHATNAAVDRSLESASTLMLYLLFPLPYTAFFLLVQFLIFTLGKASSYRYVGTVVEIVVLECFNLTSLGETRCVDMCIR